MGSGLIFEIATDGIISYEVGGALFIAAGIIYVWLGGLRAVAWTDTFQGIFMFGAVWTVGLLFVFSTYNGPVDFWTDISTELGSYLVLPGGVGAITPEFYLSMAVMFGIGIIMMPHTFIRIVSARTPRVIKWVAVFSFAYLALFYFPVLYLSLGGLEFFPDIANPDNVVLEMIYSISPSWFAAIVVSGASAAAMSTADSQMHAVAALIGRDWFAELSPSAVSSRTETRFNQAIIPVLGILSYVIALQEIALIIQLTAVAFYGVAQLLPILLGALLWKDASKEGALAGFTLGVLVTVLLGYGIVTLPNGFPGFVSGFYGFLVNVAVFVGVSVLTESVPEGNAEQTVGYIEYAENRDWADETTGGD